ncbi:MAG: methyl-accepting chemotaxis protein [Desulfocucumaceae bacterium]
MSIRTKLIIIATAFVIVGIGCLSFLSFQKTKNILTATLEESIFQTSQSSGREIGAWVNTRKTEISLLANSPVLRTGSKTSIKSYLSTEIQRNNYEMFFVADRKGNSYTTMNSTDYIGDQNYFIKVLDTDQTFISDPLLSKTSGKLIVVVAAPIKKNGAISGVIGGTVPVEDLSRLISVMQVGTTGYAYITKGDGMYIAHHNRELVMKYNPLTDSKADPGLVEATQKMIKGEHAITHYSLEGTDQYLAFNQVPGTNWSIAVTAPASELTEKLSSLPYLYIINALVISAAMIIVLVVFLRKMLKNLQWVTNWASKIASGDLTGKEIDIRSNDEIGKLAKAFNSLLANLKEITSQLQEKSNSVASSATELLASAENVAAGATETASTISQVASAVEQVTRNSRRIAESSEKAAAYAQDGSEGIKQIVVQMEAIQIAAGVSGKAIHGLNTSAGKITQIVEMITQIAEQTNLLALNAAIEAARAGEQGRGFAVVAEEVRELSEQSANAARDIYGLITAIQQESGRAVETMNDGAAQVDAGSKVISTVGGTLEKIIIAVQGLAGEIQSIASAIDKISSSVENVAAAAQEQTATMEEVSSTTEHLTVMAEELEGLSKRFNL